jgi:hypothetical protein
MTSESLRAREPRVESCPPDIAPAPATGSAARWLAVFGPGAIIASLTIGTGELVFSSRAGALFGMDVLWLFLLTCVLKWALLYGAARHMVVSGIHPFERYAQLPGPRGWFPLTLLLLALVAFPIWTGFVGGVLGTLVEGRFGVDAHLSGIVATVLAVLLVLRGGYATLERIQLAVVAALLVAVGVSLALMRPDAGAIAQGLLVPASLEYPSWLASVRGELAARPVALEAATYVGVIGGSAYDYLAYVAFLRNKRWGLSSCPVEDGADLEVIGRTHGELLRRWTRAPLVDATISFAVVLAFSVVFAVSGAMVLGPRHQIPSGDNLLNLQAQFVTQLHPWLLPLYVLGAFLAIAGTLYATIAVAPAVLGEAIPSIRAVRRSPLSGTMATAIVLWSGGGGIAVLIWSALHRVYGGAGTQPPTLVEIVTPANLFTGVLACGFICLLNPWIDIRFLPRSLHPSRALWTLNVLAGLVFLALGVRGYWDFGVQEFSGSGGGWLGWLALLLTLFAGMVGAGILGRRGARRHRGDSR